MDGKRGRVVCHLHKGGDLKDMTVEQVCTDRVQGRGPRTKPWGTPGRQVCREEKMLLHMTRKQREQVRPKQFRAKQCCKCQTKTTDQWARYCGQRCQRRPTDQEGIDNKIFSVHIALTSCAARWPPQYAPAPAHRRPTCWSESDESVDRAG